MRVLLADPYALFRELTASLLVEWGFDVVGQASDGVEAVEQCRALQPTVVLMEIRMPRCNGLEATRLIKKELPGTKIIMLTIFDEHEYECEARRSGADGYVVKTAPIEDLRRALAALSCGDVACEEHAV